jgi:hypothetical protein
VKPIYIYAKIKVGQGMWWASTQKPSLWYVRAILQAKEQKDLLGNQLARMIDVSYYPYYGSSQYDVYVTVKLKVTKVGNKDTYNFNRETIGVSSPIDLEFTNVQFSGTIIALSESQIKEEYEDKIAYFYKKNVNQWEFDQIQIGDSFSNGTKRMVEVVGKERGDVSEALIGNSMNQINWDSQLYQYVRLKVKIKVKKIGGQYIFGEDYVISPGRGIPITLNNITLNDYIVTKIE